MRLVSWLGGFVVLGAVVMTAGVVALAHHHVGSLRPLTAAHRTFGLMSYDELDPGAAPPQLVEPSPAPPPPPPAPAPEQRPAIVIGSTQQALINQDHARAGLAPLAWSGCLFSVASAQAVHLATPGVTFGHYGGTSQDLNCHLGGQTGENIGSWSLGVNDAQLNTIFMNSPTHRANILGPYRFVASAWVVGSNGYGYLVVEFG